MAFSDNIWWTKKARIEAEKRLLMYSFQSQVLLLWYYFSGVAASIYHLKNGTSSEEMWVIYSVLTLCISVFISGLSFKERAALIKDSYEALNTLYYKVKSVESERGEEANKRIALLRDEYSQLMGTSENHTDTDFSKAVCIAYYTSNGIKDKKSKLKDGITKAPTKLMLIDVVLWYLKKYALFIGLFTIPIAVPYILVSFK